MAVGELCVERGNLSVEARTLTNAIRGTLSGDGSAAGEDCRLRMGRRSLSECLRRCIRSARTSALTTLCWSRVRRRAKRVRRSIVCRRTLSGTTWAAGRALHEHVADCPPEEVAVANVFEEKIRFASRSIRQGNYVYAPGQGDCAGWREQSGGGADRAMLC